MLTTILLDQLCSHSAQYPCGGMADEQLEFGLSPLGSVFSPGLESRTSHLLQSEQKVSKAAFKLDRLSQELQSIWSTQGSPTTPKGSGQLVQAQGKGIPVTTENSIGAPISNTLGLQQKYETLWPEAGVTRNTSQSSQSYSPLTSQPASSSYTFDPLQPGQRAQSDRAPPPGMKSGSLTPYSQPDQRVQPDRAPSPRMTSASLTPYSQPDQRAQPDRAPSPRMMSGSLTPYSQLDLRVQPDRAPSPRMMSLPLTPSSQLSQRAQPDRAPSPMREPKYSSAGQHSVSYSQCPFSPILSPFDNPGYTPDSLRRVSSREDFQRLHSASSPVLQRRRLAFDTQDASAVPRPKPESVLEPGSFDVRAGETVKQRKVPKVWAEADLDVAYEKKSPKTPSHENKRDSNQISKKPGGGWRQTDLDLAVPPSKLTGGQASLNSAQIYGTLPRSGQLPSASPWWVHAPPSKPRRHSPQWGAPRLPGPNPAWAGLPVGSPRASAIKERHTVLPLSVFIRPSMVSGWGRGKGRGKLLPGPPTSAGPWRQPPLRHTQEVSSSLTPGSVREVEMGRILTLDEPGMDSTLPPGESGIGSTLSSGEPGTGSTLPPGEPGTDSTLPLGELGTGSTLSLAEPGMGGTLPPGEPEMVSTLPPDEVEMVSTLSPGEVEGGESPPRPLSPTRLQPVTLPDTEAVHDMEELLQIRAAIPRALKKRSSIEMPAEELVPLQRRARRYQQLTQFFTRRRQPEMVEESTPVSEPELTLLPSTTPTDSPAASPLKRSILKREGRRGSSKKMRARLSPFVILLDAALLGELDVVQRVVHEVDDPSQSNDEGITALHNAVCGSHYDVVEFLVNIGVNINALDSHGWTPLHCAASCNDLAICTLLVKKGAAIFTTTLTDGATAAEKCDVYLDGYEECARFLFSAEQQAGMMNSAVLYALWDYEAENDDELSFREGEAITVLRRGDGEESQWWWASLYGHEGYVPYNILGLFPRVRAAA